MSLLPLRPPGSGVLVRVADAALLVSASHVFFDKQDPDARELYITSGLPDSTFVSLGGLDVKASHDQKDVDIAFVRELTEGMLYSDTVVAGAPEFRPNDDITVAIRVITRKSSNHGPRQAF